jgi:organic radical activating enzyme
MFGKNKILKPEIGDGSSLKIVDIFATFQGEAIYSGYPAIFIRLGGCNLACKFCDTEFDDFAEFSLEEIIKKVNNINQNNFAKLAVITGGEPMRQPIVKLCQKLIENGFLVQIETNGTLYQDLPKDVKIICSPKNNQLQYSQIRADLLKKISAFKFLISASDKNYNFVPEVGQSKYNIPIYLQPMDEYNSKKNQDNQNLTIKIAQERGYRISLQMHKTLGIE